MKTLESIREEIWEEMLRLEGKRKGQWADIKYQTLREVLQKLGHLDEPEVLSQEWVEDNFFEVENWDDEVFISDGETAIDGTLQIKVIALQDLKKVINVTRELPVIPKFVADFIKENKGRLNVYGGLVDVQSTQEGKVWEWVFYNHNQDEFAEAWLAYPNVEVEEEQKYVIDTDDAEISDGNHYLTHLSLSKDDTELPIVGYKDDAIRFDNKEQAQAIADYVGGRVEELEE